MAATVRKQKPSTENLKNFPGGETRWKNGVPIYGWYRMADQWWEHLPRLQRGLYQRMLIEYVWASTVPREGGAILPEWSRPLSWSDMAARFRCSPAQLHDDARDAHHRGLIEIKGYKGDGSRFENRGKAEIRILWQKWADIKDYTAPRPQLVEKKQAKLSAHWFNQDVDIQPGESYAFTVPPLPENFGQLQTILFKNTGESESVKIAGGGPAENGMIVLETKVKISAPVKSKTSARKGAFERECTPQKSVPERESTPQRFVLPPPLVDACATFGLVSDDAIIGMVVACQNAAKDCTIEEITQQVILIGGNASKSRGTVNPAGVVKTQVPKYFASTKYQTTPKKPAKSEPDRCEVHGYPMPCNLCWRERRAAKEKVS
jgi:hypothetical protein